jgi:hypothetical protein
VTTRSSIAATPDLGYTGERAKKAGNPIIGVTPNKPCRMYCMPALGKRVTHHHGAVQRRGSKFPLSLTLAYPEPDLAPPLRPSGNLFPHDRQVVCMSDESLADTAVQASPAISGQRCARPTASRDVPEAEFCGLHDVGNDAWCSRAQGTGLSEWESHQGASACAETLFPFLLRARPDRVTHSPKPTRFCHPTKMR